MLQLSRFPWGEDPGAWLRSMALAADEAGFAGLAVMDHLIQIPQVDRAWEPIPEPWVTLGLVAGLDTRLRLGTLVTPVTFRPPGITAKAAATLDALTGGRAFVGVGAGWWDREHAAYGLPFPPARERLDALEAGIETMRALWAAGTKAYDGERVSLPETTSLPAPGRPDPGHRRRQRRAADAGASPRGSATAATCPPTSSGSTASSRCCAGTSTPSVARTTTSRSPSSTCPSSVATATTSGRGSSGCRGRTPAAAYAEEEARRHGGPSSGTGTAPSPTAGSARCSLGVPDLDGPDDVLALAGLNA